MLIITHELSEEITGILEKGYNTVIVSDKDQRDKRRFTKIMDINLNKLIFESGIEKKYIHFFILLVNINTIYIEPDINIINLQTKEIAKNMGYSTVYLYNCCKILKENNIIDYYQVGNNKYIVINPCYYARFFNIRYMYLLENAFNKETISICDTIDRIKIIKTTLANRKNIMIDQQIKKYMADNPINKKTQK